MNNTSKHVVSLRGEQEWRSDESTIDHPFHDTACRSSRLSKLPSILCSVQMTPGELKFALCVEAALNRIPEPEYRQLVVEMLMVLSLVNEYHPEQTLGDTIDVDELVWEGHNLYLKDQVGKLMPFEGCM